YLGKDALEEDSRLGLPNEQEFSICERKAREQGVEEEWIKKMSKGMTGFVATFDTKKTGKHLAFRFDIDALPIQEDKTSNHLPFNEGFNSLNDGVMHACGHDGHAAIGIGLATYIHQHNYKLKGKFTLLFQPAEE